jgi:CheY-like chemotaxis protein
MRNNHNRVLVVDDIWTSLSSAELVLSFHNCRVEKANDGQTAIQKIKSGNVYDIIFMDLLMPVLNGIDTTKELREMGYKGAIVVLTSIESINDIKSDIEGLFDGFLSKPIDEKKLKEVLDEFNVKNYFESSGDEFGSVSYEARMREAFLRDVEKATSNLKKPFNEIKSPTSVFHGIKTTLANMGERESYDVAASLEKACINGDMGYVKFNVDLFVQILERLAERYSDKKTEPENPPANVRENTGNIIKKLKTINSYCAQYNMDSAYSEILDLLSMKLKPSTKEFADSIRELLYSESDFEQTCERITKFLERYKITQKV